MVENNKAEIWCKIQTDKKVLVNHADIVVVDKEWKRVVDIEVATTSHRQIGKKEHKKIMTLTAKILHS